MALSLIDTRTVVETPENVLLTFEVAGPGTRIGAYLIDLLIRYGVFWLCACLITLVIPFLPFLTALPLGGIMVVIFLLEWGYTTAIEGLWRGQTPGKRYFQLRVIKDAGYPITFYDAALRNLLRAADILPFGYGIGLITMFATRRQQRIGDLVAGTIVIRDQRHRFARDTSLYSKLEPIPPSACPARYHVSERTLDVIEQLLSRKEVLSKRRLEEIASILAPAVARHLGYARERDGGATDLYFLRRVLRTFSTVEKGRSA